MTDYAELIKELRSHKERWECAGGGGWETPEVCIQAAAALHTLLERNKELERERDEAQREAKKQKERLFKQIYFTDELQRLLWALAEGNPLPDTIKEGHAYTVASRAKARAEAAEAKLAEARKVMKLAEQMMTKDSLCEAERLEEGLSVVRRALEGEQEE